MKVPIFLYFLLSIGSVYGQSAYDIVKQTDEKMRGKTSEATMIIKTIRPSWSREMKIKSWIKGTENALLLIQSPAKEKGIVFLKRKKEVWNWIPALEKTIKLPPSMMSQSWMGTDFTNDDLVKESSIVNEYTHQILGDTTINNSPCYKIQCTPKAETAVVWGKVLLFIDKDSLLEMYVEFYDEESILINTMKSYDVKLMDGRLIPTRFEMIPVDKKNQKTEIIYESILFNRVLSDQFFTLEQMKRLN